MDRYNSDFDHVGDYVERWNAGVRRTRTWMIVLAVVLILIGAASVIAPFGLYELIQTLISVTLVAGGVGQIVSYARTPELFRSPTSLVMGVLNALLGVLLFVLPAYLTASTIVFLLAFALCIFVDSVSRNDEEDAALPLAARILKGLAGMVMLLSVAVYLFIGFMYGIWHPSWVCFIIAFALMLVFEHTANAVAGTDGKKAEGEKNGEE